MTRALLLITLTLTACAPALPQAANSAVIAQVERVGDAWVNLTIVNGVIFTTGTLLIMLALVLSTFKVAPELGNALVNWARAGYAAQTYRVKAELIRLNTLRTIGAPPEIETDGTDELALELLRDAARVNGEASAVIPRWERINQAGVGLRQWSGEAWQKATDAMGEWVVKSPSGTLLRGEHTVTTFARAIRYGTIELVKSPPTLPE